MRQLDILAMTLYAVTFFGALAVGVICLRRRFLSPAARYLPIVMTGIMWWVGCLFWQIAPLGPSVNQLGFSSYTISLPILAGGYWLSAQGIKDPGYRPSRRTVVIFLGGLAVVTALCCIPVTSLMIMHPVGVIDGRWMWRFDWLFWAIAAVCYGFMTATMAIEVRAMRHASPLLRAHLGINLAGAVVAVPGMVASTLLLMTGPNLLPLPIVEWTAVGWLCTVLLDLYSLRVQGFLTLVPLARERILEELEVAVLVFDRDGRLTDLNAQAAALFDSTALSASLLMGRRLRFVVSCLGPGVAPISGDYRLERGGSAVEVELRVQPITTIRGQIGTAVVIADVTTANESRRAQQAVNAELQQQLVTIDALRRDLVDQASRDSLTGLYNRRRLDTELDGAVAQARAASRPLAVAVLDLDHFKAINDRHGHLVGDEVLEEVGARLAAYVARSPAGGLTVGRFGGEEFVLILRGRSVEQAQQLVQEVRVGVREADPDRSRGAADHHLGRSGLRGASRLGR